MCVRLEAGKLFSDSSVSNLESAFQFLEEWEPQEWEKPFTNDKKGKLTH